jgi:hypothetical protein
MARLKCVVINDVALQVRSLLKDLEQVCYRVTSCVIVGDRGRESETQT